MANTGQQIKGETLMRFYAVRKPVYKSSEVFCFSFSMANF